MLKFPKVSVLIPIFGVENYIERCAVSLFRQTYDNIEYIFVNDCTPDNSIKILLNTIDSYSNIKSKVKIVHHDKNKGLAASRNTAVENSTGDFLIHVDSDDYLELDTIELCVKKQMETGADIVSFDFIMHYGVNDSIVTKKHISSNKCYTLCRILSRNTFVCLCGMLIKASIYKDNDITAVVGVNNSEDYQTSPRLMYYANNVVYLDKPLYHYDRTNEKSFTLSFSVSKGLQSFKAINVLEMFFNNKDEIYKEALIVGKLKIYTAYRIGFIRNNCEDLAFWNYINDQLATIPIIYKQKIRIVHRITLFIKDKNILRLYVYLMDLIKKIVKK